jgi:hypothetical protein
MRRGAILPCFPLPLEGITEHRADTVCGEATGAARGVPCGIASQTTRPSAGNDRRTLKWVGGGRLVAGAVQADIRPWVDSQHQDLFVFGLLRARRACEAAGTGQVMATTSFAIVEDREQAMTAGGSREIDVAIAPIRARMPIDANARRWPCGF